MIGYNTVQLHEKQRNSSERINQVISQCRGIDSRFLRRGCLIILICVSHSYRAFFIRCCIINYYDQRVKRYAMFEIIRFASSIPGEVRFFFLFSISDSVLEKDKRTNIISKRFKRCVVWNRFSVALAFSRWNSFKYRSEYCIRSQGHFEPLR